MAETPGLILARVADTGFTGQGPSSALQWIDRNGDPISVVPDEEYLALLFGQVVNEAANDQWGELRFAFDGVTIQRSRSSFRFTTINGNDASGGQCPGLALLTGDSVASLTAHLLGEATGSVTDCAGVEALLVPTSELEDFGWHETTNSDALYATPTDGAGWVTVESYAFTPDTTTTGPANRYMLIVGFELAGNGGESANTEPTRAEYSGRVLVDGLVFEQSFEMDVAIGYAAGETMHSVRFDIPIDATQGEEITVEVQVNGTLGLGTIGARRIRFASFRGPLISFSESTAGIDGNPGAAGTLALPGASVAIADAGETLLTTYLGTFQVQAATFAYGQFDIDSGSSYQPTQGFFRGVSNSGVTSSDDLMPVSAQYSEPLSSGAHTLGMRGTWIAAGTVTWGRNRGNTTDVPQTLVAIQWLATEGGDPGIDGLFSATTPGLRMLAEGSTTTPTPGELEGLFSSLLPALRMLAIGELETDNPLSYLSEVFAYDGDPRDHGWLLLNLVAGNEPAQCSVHDGELHLEPTAGNAGGSFWFNDNDGILLWREIPGWQWRITASMRVLNSAGTGLPPVANFRMGVLQVHDPADWPSTPSASDANRVAPYNYVHGGFGSFGLSEMRAEWKGNVDGVTTTGSVSWPTGEGYIRIERQDQTFIVAVSLDGASWTEIQSFDRSASPMPYVCRWGFGCYASVTTHDIQLRVAAVTVESLASDYSSILPILRMLATGDVSAQPIVGEYASSLPVIDMVADGDAYTPIEGLFSATTPGLRMLAEGSTTTPTPGELEGLFSSVLPALRMLATGSLTRTPVNISGSFFAGFPGLRMSAAGEADGPGPNMGIDRVTPVTTLQYERNLIAAIKRMIPSLELERDRGWRHDANPSDTPGILFRSFVIAWGSTETEIGGTTGDGHYEVASTISIVTDYRALPSKYMGPLINSDHQDLLETLQEALDPEILGHLGCESLGISAEDEDARYGHNFTVRWYKLRSRGR